MDSTEVDSDDTRWSKVFENCDTVKDIYDKYFSATVTKKWSPSDYDKVLTYQRDNDFDETSQLFQDLLKILRRAVVDGRETGGSLLCTTIFFWNVLKRLD